MSQQSEVVVVTGASAGLGRAIAQAFAARGARLGLLARNPEALAAAVRECEQLGGQAIAIATDVSDADAVERAAAAVEEQFGPIDVWVNNAMVSVFAPVAEMTAAEYKRVTEVTYLGYVHGTLSALRRMKPRDQGTIVQVGSALSYRSIPLQSAYCAAKHAINGFTDSLRCELHHDSSRVRVTAVHMPAMNTTQFGWVRNKMPNNGQPVAPIFQPELCAQVVVEAATAAHPRREYWVGGPTVAAIVGQRIIPGSLDMYLGKTGFDSQQIPGEPHDPAAPDNLFAYVPGTHSVRGRFSRESTSQSAFVSASKHPAAATVAFSALAGAAAFAIFRKLRG